MDGKEKGNERSIRGILFLPCPALRATKTFGYRHGGTDFFVYLLGKEVKNKGSEGWARLNERTVGGRGRGFSLCGIAMEQRNKVVLSLFHE